MNRLSVINRGYHGVWHVVVEEMMAEFGIWFVLRAERKDNSDGKTMFGLFLLVSVTIIQRP